MNETTYNRMKCILPIPSIKASKKGETSHVEGRSRTECMTACNSATCRDHQSTSAKGEQKEDNAIAGLKQTASMLTYAVYRPYMT